jgi:hypothetical protein
MGDQELVSLDHSGDTGGEYIRVLLPEASDLSNTRMGSKKSLLELLAWNGESSKLTIQVRGFSSRLKRALGCVLSRCRCRVVGGSDSLYRQRTGNLTSSMTMTSRAISEEVEPTELRGEYLIRWFADGDGIFIALTYTSNV